MSLDSVADDGPSSWVDGGGGGWRWRSETYRAVRHWDCGAIVNYQDQLYPCRLIGSLVGCFTADGDEPDTSDRVWAAQALGLPAGLFGPVTVTVAGVASDAQLDDDQLTGTGDVWTRTIGSPK
jgi:hypothetical protein